MKKLLLFALMALGCMSLIAVEWWWDLPKNPPPAITDKLRPSCHWSGSPDQNNWIVVFQVDDLKHQKLAWKQQVAIGVSEQDAEHLCDAYVDLGRLN